MICIPVTIEILPSKTPAMKHPFASLSFIDPLPHTLSLVSCLVSFFKPRFLGMFPLVRSGEASQMVNVSAGSSPRAMLVPWCLFWRRSHHRHHHCHHRGLFPSLLLFVSFSLSISFFSSLPSFLPSFLPSSLFLSLSRRLSSHDRPFLPSTLLLFPVHTSWCSLSLLHPLIFPPSLSHLFYLLPISFLSLHSTITHSPAP